GGGGAGVLPALAVVAAGTRRVRTGGATPGNADRRVRPGAGCVCAEHEGGQLLHGADVLRGAAGLILEHDAGGGAGRLHQLGAGGQRPLAATTMDGRAAGPFPLAAPAGGRGLSGGMHRRRAACRRLAVPPRKRPLPRSRTPHTHPPPAGGGEEVTAWAMGPPL